TDRARGLLELTQGAVPPLTLPRHGTVASGSHDRVRDEGPSPEEAPLISRCALFDATSPSQAIGQFLERMTSFSWEDVVGLGIRWWVPTTLALAAVVGEIARRNFRKPERHTVIEILFDRPYSV